MIQANVFRRPPEELESLDHLEAEPPERLADGIVALRDEFGLKVLGGCCGTDNRHIAALADRLTVGSAELLSRPEHSRILDWPGGHGA